MSSSGISGDLSDGATAFLLDHVFERDVDLPLLAGLHGSADLDDLGRCAVLV